MTLRTVGIWGVCLALLLGCVSACGGIGGGRVHWTPEARLLAARETFNGTVNTLAAMRANGKFTAKEAEVTGLFIVAGQRTLDRWDAALELGQPPAGIIREFNQIIRELVATRKAVERAAGP